MHNNYHCDYPIDSMYGGYFIITPDGKTNWFNNLEQYDSYVAECKKSFSELYDYDDNDLNFQNNYEEF